MKSYAFVIFLHERACGAGTLTLQRGACFNNRLRKMYGAKKDGFSWQVWKMD